MIVIKESTHADIKDILPYIFEFNGPTTKRDFVDAESAEEKEEPCPSGS